VELVFILFEVAATSSTQDPTKDYFLASPLILKPQTLLVISHYGPTLTAAGEDF
jgi:hypothetical protein